MGEPNFTALREQVRRNLCDVGGKDGPCYNSTLIAIQVLKDLKVRPKPYGQGDPGMGYRGGELEELYLITPEGTIRRLKIPLWPWYWHEKIRAVVAYAQGRIDGYVSSPGGRGLGLGLAGYEDWWGTVPMYYTEARYSDAGLRDLGVCIATRYATDRHGERERYIHVHGPGVRAYETEGQVVVRGGDLMIASSGLMK